MSPAWKTELWRIGAVILAAASVGWTVGQLSLSLLIGSIGYAGWHLHHLVRLTRMLREQRRLHRPFPSGLWTPVYQAIQDVQVRERKHKRRERRFFSRFREAAAALPDAAVILNRNEAIEWCNAAAESLLGLSWPLVAGNSLTSEIREPIVEEFLSKADYTRSLEFVSPVNKTKVLSLLVKPIGRKKRKLVIARDITQVYLLDQTRRDFVANVSHELRTPLTVIAGFLETFAEESANAPGWKRSVELMRQQTKSMERLISDLLTLSRLEMEDAGSDPGPVPVPNLLAAIAEEVRAFSGTSGHVIELDSESDLWLQGHAEELRSAFSNLVFNAVRHTPDRTEVHIRWYSDGVGAHLSVRDNGEGIPTRHLPRLTERFYRVDKSRSPGSGGTGLGLAIVKHVLTRHGAELSIASTVGNGSTFVCHFPPSVVVHHGEQDGSDADQDDLHANAR